MRKKKLRKILEILSPNVVQDELREFDAQLEKLKQGLQQKVRAKTLDDVNERINAFRKGIDLKPIQSSLDNFSNFLANRMSMVEEVINAERADIDREIKGLSAGTQKNFGSLIKELQDYRDEQSSLRDIQESTVSTLQSRIDELASLYELLSSQDLTTPLEERISLVEKSEKWLPEVERLTTEIEKLRKELTNRINTLPRGGGNANRNIAIAGNVNTLNKYTDINLKAGAGISITYTNNETTKYTDITIAATGGGGGIVREVNVISTNTNAGDTAGIDYVYVVSGTTTVTLPTAVGNTNLYTIKNVGAGVILIATTGGQSIDGDASLSLVTQFTSVDLISDGSNWNIT